MGEGVEERKERQSKERVTLRDLLKMVNVILRSALLPSICNFGSSLYCLYMFRPNRPSSGVQVVRKESTHGIASSQQPSTSDDGRLGRNM
jgi:hypothetical protein